MPAPKQQRERPIGSDWTELAQTLIDVRSCCKPSRSNQHIIALHQIPLRSVANLIRAFYRVGRNPSVEFMRLNSYGIGRESSGHVRLIGEFEVDLSGRTVLLVDDVVDTGRTLLYARDLLRDKRASSILTCALVDKPSRREVPIKIDFVGFTIPDVFVVGYGIDCAHEYRHLPFIAKID
jgi:hypoxanthine phosphoribosyltransferase